MWLPIESRGEGGAPIAALFVVGQGSEVRREGGKTGWSFAEDCKALGRQWGREKENKDMVEVEGDTAGALGGKGGGYWGFCRKLLRWRRCLAPRLVHRDQVDEGLK